MYVLAALAQNDADGTLYSIDDPAPHLPPGKDPGWIVPDELRPSWELTLGKSQDELEPLLARIDAPEFFYHDSWHTYPLMQYELLTAAESMERGVFSAHDVNRNHAFLQLCSSIGGPLNVDRPFELGGMGAFGFTYVGESLDRTPTAFPSHQYSGYDPTQIV